MGGAYVRQEPICMAGPYVFSRSIYIWQEPMYDRNLYYVWQAAGAYVWQEPICMARTYVWQEPIYMAGAYVW